MTDTDTSGHSSASDGDSTRTVYGAARVPRRVRRQGGGGTPQYPLVPRLQVAAIPGPRTPLDLFQMQSRIARDQAYIPRRYRLPLPSSWNEDEANGHIVPGSGNNTERTRRIAGPLVPSEWQHVESTQRTFGTFIEESPVAIR